MLGLILLIILVVGTVLYGANFLIQSWQLVRNGALVVGGAVLANRYFRLLLGGMIVGLLLPVLGGSLGVSLGHYPSAGPEVGRILIFFTYVFSFLVLATIWKLADLFAQAIIVLSLIPRDLDKVRVGIRVSVLGALAWELFIGMLLIVFGVYAPAVAVAVAIFGALLYFVTTKAYNLPVKWFPKVAVASGLGLVFWALLASTPTSFWMATIGIDIRPNLNFHSGIDHLVAESAEQARWERERELCSQEIKRLEGELRLAVNLETLRERSETLETKKSECSKRTAWRWR